MLSLNSSLGSPTAANELGTSTVPRRLTRITCWPSQTQLIKSELEKKKEKTKAIFITCSGFLSILTWSETQPFCKSERFDL